MVKEIHPLDTYGAIRVPRWLNRSCFCDVRWIMKLALGNMKVENNTHRFMTVNSLQVPQETRIC